jgi:hypothetical protein
MEAHDSLTRWVWGDFGEVIQSLYRTLTNFFESPYRLMDDFPQRPQTHRKSAKRSQMSGFVSRVDTFLTGVANQPRRRGNLVFALDATASREHAWDTACQLQAQMFQEVATLGTLSMQLVYYRGAPSFGGECKASRWVNDPMQLAQLMTKITCDAGYTQIARVLAHVSRETLQRKVNALVFVGDACEENRDQLVEPAKQLAQLEVPAFMFQEGHDPTAAKRFQEIARITHGAYLRFNQGAAQQLSEILRAVAAFAVGSAAALERQSSAAAKLLLEQVKS